MIGGIVFVGLLGILVGLTVVSYRKEPEVMWNRLQRLGVGLLAIAPICALQYLFPTEMVVILHLIGLFVVVTKVGNFVTDRYVPKVLSEAEKEAAKAKENNE